MLGFAIVDHRAECGTAAVWLISLLASNRADHTNAVTINLDSDDDALKKLHALTRDRLVLLTAGSTSDGLPVTSSTLSIEDVASLAEHTEAHQDRIVEAIDAYAKRTKNQNLVRPTFDRAVSPDEFVPSEDTPTQRAFQAANYAARVWTNWLTTDEERRKRSENPRTKKSPWIMPAEMSSKVIEPLPATFAKAFSVQPLEAFNA